MKNEAYLLESSLRRVRFRLTRKLTSRDVRDVWPGITQVSVTNCPFSNQYGNVSRDELLVLCAVAKHMGAKRLFEIGTFNGLTTWHLARNSQGRVYTLDLSPDHALR